MDGKREGRGRGAERSGAQSALHRNSDLAFCSQRERRRTPHCGRVNARHPPNERVSRRTKSSHIGLSSITDTATGLGTPTSSSIWVM